MSQTPSPTSGNHEAAHAMVLQRTGDHLVDSAWSPPEPVGHELLLRVHACGVCRTDLHIIDGELDVPSFPLIPGHEIVGTILARGNLANCYPVGARVGTGWLAGACGRCEFCRRGRENLCAKARFTGFHQHGGYASLAIADEQFCFAIPDSYDDISAAPLLCAGLIGYRALQAAGDARRLGIFGFGAAGHLVAQIGAKEGREVFAFTRPGDFAAQQLAMASGCCWAGGSDQSSPASIDAAILFAPIGDLVPVALTAVERGGTVVCAGIHMSDIPSFPYRILWGERVIRSIANLTRADGHAFMRLAGDIPLKVATQVFPLSQANVALDCMRSGSLAGAAVLQCWP